MDTAMDHYYAILAGGRFVHLMHAITIVLGAVLRFIITEEMVDTKPKKAKR
jgi:hypothetical protein